ncbi:cold shock domain-containing protein [Streptomyces sp. NPDC051162]|uniref:cold shock domain-containing protein n=1 Tax=Streptomyces sp. NPDC051162 TaxID=3154747 RepID=UPI003414B9C6
MAKIKGQVKWFNESKGFGFITQRFSTVGATTDNGAVTGVSAGDGASRSGP